MDQPNKNSVFAGKSVLITGHTGFKGVWLSLLLQSFGARIFGYALPSVNNPIFDDASSGLFQKSWLEDIRNAAALKQAIEEAQPDIIFHLAAQPLVIDSYKNPLYTFDVNVMGTATLLDALRGYSRPCAVVVITTDKVYENLEWVYPYRETDLLGGHDPYSSSKACAELVVQSYRKSYFSSESLANHGKVLACVRAGNVIGGGDWSANRIIPDIVRAFHANEILEVRNPKAVRPWQHVLDALYGYLLLAQRMLSDPQDAKWHSAWNFGPVANDNLPVESLVELAAQHWGGGQCHFHNSSSEHMHEAGLLRLDCSKAQQHLGWLPIWDAPTAIQKTLEWYGKTLMHGKAPAAVARQQIQSFLAQALTL